MLYIIWNGELKSLTLGELIDMSELLPDGCPIDGDAILKASKGD